MTSEALTTKTADGGEVVVAVNALVPMAQDGLASELAKWTPKSSEISFAVCQRRKRLYRKTKAAWAVGGYVIHSVSLSNVRLVREWLS